MIIRTASLAIAFPMEHCKIYLKRLISFSLIVMVSWLRLHLSYYITVWTRVEFRFVFRIPVKYNAPADQILRENFAINVQMDFIISQNAFVSLNRFSEMK